MGSLQYLLGNVADSKNYFEQAYQRTKEEAVDDEQYSKEISYTIRYNLARVFEGLCQYDKAERLYKDILLECPNYIECYLRLGCMLRDRGQIYEASDKFKDALQFSNEHPDAWSLIGNLHLAKQGKRKEVSGTCVDHVQASREERPQEYLGCQRH